MEKHLYPSHIIESRYAGKHVCQNIWVIFMREIEKQRNPGGKILLHLDFKDLKLGLTSVGQMDY